MAFLVSCELITSLATISEENMAKVIVDIFQAATETTSGTLRWIVLYMLLYPEIQTRCQEEIDRVSCLNIINVNVRTKCWTNT